MTSVKLDICLKRGLFLSTLDPIHRMATTARCLPLDRAGLQLNGDAYPGSRTIAAAPASVRLPPAASCDHPSETAIARWSGRRRVLSGTAVLIPEDGQ